jgi:hypothetical protein
MKFILAYLLLVLFIIQACDNEDDNQFSLNEEFSIEEGDRFQNHLHNISINFDSLINDSRCPEDMICIFSGTAVAAFTFTSNDRLKSLRLYAFDDRELQYDTSLFGYTISLKTLYRDPELVVPSSDPRLAEIIPYIAEMEILKQ